MKVAGSCKTMHVPHGPFTARTCTTCRLDPTVVGDIIRMVDQLAQERPDIQEPQYRLIQ